VDAARIVSATVFGYGPSMPPRPAFVLFGPAHLTMLVLALLAPTLLALAARRNPNRDRPIRFFLAALLGGGWLCWYALFAARGWLTLNNALPLNLCDWAALALIATLIRPCQFSYELGYFWGLGGTLQGMVTPDIAYDFPDPQFIFFFINHAGIITALLYLTFTGMRPWPRSLPRVAAATLGYAVVAGLADYLLHTNYGFLAAKPAIASVMDLLSPWPWYIPELVGIGLLSLLVYYAPFFVLDRLRPYRATARAPSSRIRSGNAPSL
jgi:hypothetical integral membrane protein (TIGR02206 family)